MVTIRPALGANLGNAGFGLTNVGTRDYPLFYAAWGEYYIYAHRLNVTVAFPTPSPSPSPPVPEPEPEPELEPEPEPEPLNRQLHSRLLLQLVAGKNYNLRIESDSGTGTPAFRSFVLGNVRLVLHSN
eukprot:tig00000836_g4717.t1